MAEAIYTLCTLTALACAWLLLRGYRLGRSRLLLWSGICFAVLSVNNVLVILDNIVFPDVDLSTWRLLAALLAPLLLLYGLIMEDE
jgi:hypothetical protein